MTINEEETSSVGDFKETVVKETSRDQYFFYCKLAFNLRLLQN